MRKEGYELFIKCKELPKYKVEGEYIITDDLSYNYVFKGGLKDKVSYKPNGIEFDYQKYIVEKSTDKKYGLSYTESRSKKGLIASVHAHLRFLLLFLRSNRYRSTVSGFLG